MWQKKLLAEQTAHRMGEILTNYASDRKLVGRIYKERQGGKKCQTIRILK